jgi:hypothetical protein
MPYSKIGWLSNPASQALAYLEAPPSRALPITARSCRFLGLLACEIGFEIPLKNRHLGVCKPPPVASLQCRRPAHPLVSVSMGCWIAGCWRANAFSIRLQLVQVPGSRAAISCAAPMVGASSRQQWSEATGAGRRARQRGGLSKRQTYKWD